MKLKSSLNIIGAASLAIPAALSAQAVDEIEELEKGSPLAFLNEMETDASATFGWDSIYLAEGRDDLGDGGLVYSEFTGSAGPVALGTWYADATDVDYNEWNLFGEIAFELTEGLEAYVGYTYLAFFEDGEKSDDSEVGVGVSYAITDYLEASADYVYSFEAEGSFVEVAIAAPYEISEGFSVAPYALLGIDFGYRTEEYDGWNHLQVGLDAEYLISERFAVGGYAAYAFALRDIEKEEDTTGQEIGDQPAFGVYASVGF
ncbi:hypothetical protein J3R74_000480 [Puniceicoccus vermicola]|uniref:Porin n=2 Tax=Puniceicoccus vermicola TaxID=388746 RepID=A0A7X1E466_9BACT|nr:hypothetical protein [Puniceicoccus vermicola]MBC2602255.1 hypothetical protein [Puniceicoccus vermicola]